jgi:glycyl-tRNA synthetase beta chain
MGRYYALHDKEDAAVADAVRDHYKPVGPSDAVPTDKVAIAVALADKLDQLVGFFAIGEKPTGSGDPYALRRATLGLIRIILANELRLDILEGSHAATMLAGVAKAIQGVQNRALLDLNKKPIGDLAAEIGPEQVVEALTNQLNPDATVDEMRKNYAALDPFIAERLKVALRDKGIRHDLIDAAFYLGNGGDLVRLVARVEALQAFLKSDDGANLLAGYKRAANILKAEEKKDGKTFISEVNEALLSEPAEKALAAVLAKARAAVTPALEKEDFAGAMRQMAALRGPVDAFFEGVKVNADDKQVRENRLNLLASLRATLHQVADFSKIEG